MAPCRTGTAAPDFTIPSGPDSQVRLSDLRGKPVILAFYPADWSPVCGDEKPSTYWEGFLSTEQAHSSCS
jgi:peroxiredoxin